MWETAVFLLNVLAFLLMGLQARADPRAACRRSSSGEALGFARRRAAVVIVVRIAWVLLYNAVGAGVAERSAAPSGAPTVRKAVAGRRWCGMRGLVTLATALRAAAGISRRAT